MFLLLNIILLITTQTKTLTQECDIDRGKYAILFDVPEEVRESYLNNNPEHKLPVLILFIDNGSVRFPKQQLPRVYVAIWEDGVIVWGACKGHKLIAGDIEDDNMVIKYFQSKIGRDSVEKLLAHVMNSSVWDDAIPIQIRWFANTSYNQK